MNTSLLKCFVPIFAACAMAMAACSSDNSAAEAQSKVDSIVNAKTATLKIKMKQHTDSLIDAMALQRADSILPANAATATKPNAPAKK